MHQEIKNSNVCEDIKEEIKEEESVDDPLHTTSSKSETTNTEEWIDNDSLFVPEINKLGDEEINRVVDDIDIVQHKIKTDI
jgi:hypothetical protein